MKQILTLAGVIALAASLGQGVPAQAGETGVASIHSWVKIGGKTCLVDHYHDGSGTGSSRASAQAAAIRSWAEFTTWEYGNSWGRYGLGGRQVHELQRWRRQLVVQYIRARLPRLVIATISADTDQRKARSSSGRNAALAGRSSM